MSLRIMQSRMSVNSNQERKKKTHTQICRIAIRKSKFDCELTSKTNVITSRLTTIICIHIISE